MIGTGRLFPVMDGTDLTLKGVLERFTGKKLEPGGAHTPLSGSVEQLARSYARLVSLIGMSRDEFVTDYISRWEAEDRLFRTIQEDAELVIDRLNHIRALIMAWEPPSSQENVKSGILEEIDECMEQNAPEDRIGRRPDTTTFTPSHWEHLRMASIRSEMSDIQRLCEAIGEDAERYAKQEISRVELMLSLPGDAHRPILREELAEMIGIKRIQWMAPSSVLPSMRSKWSVWMVRTDKGESDVYVAHCSKLIHDERRQMMWKPFWLPGMNALGEIPTKMLRIHKWKDSAGYPLKWQYRHRTSRHARRIASGVSNSLPMRPEATLVTSRPATITAGNM